MFFVEMFQIPQMFLPETFQIPQMFYILIGMREVQTSKKCPFLAALFYSLMSL